MTAASFSPQNRDAELGVIGSALIDNLSLIETAPIVKPDHLASEDTRIVWRHVLMLHMEGNPVDQITLAEALKQSGEFTKVGGDLFILGCLRSVPNARHASRYAQHIVDKAAARSLLTACDEITARISSGEDTAESLIAEAQRKIMDVADSSVATQYIDIRDSVLDRVEAIKQRRDQGWTIPGISTGYPEVDEYIGGLQPSHVIVLAARPAIGKTSFALNIADHVATDQGIAVGVASLEMSKGELEEKVLVARARVPGKRVKRGQNLQPAHISRLEAAAHTIAMGAPILVDDTFTMGSIQLLSLARKMKSQQNIGLFVLDYIQLVAAESEKDSRQEQVTKISRSLKAIAKTLQIPVLALAQLNRNLESREDKRPMLADLRECVAGDQTVIDSRTGVPRVIKSLVDSQSFPQTVSMTSDYKVSNSDVAEVWPSGVKQLYRVRTKSGRVLRCTEKHRLFTFDGWRELKDIQCGERIAVPRWIPEPTSPVAGLTVDEARLLGYLICCGSYIKHRSVGYTKDDPEMVDEVRQIAYRRFGITAKDKKQRGAAEDITLSVEGAVSGQNPLIEWLKELGIHGQYSHEKVIPDLIYQLPNEILKEFIGTLIAGDGTVMFRSNGKSGLVRFVSSSETLARSLQHLLLRFGVVSSVSDPYRNTLSKRDLWSVSVGEADAIIELDRHITLPGRKGEKLRNLASMLKQSNRNAHIDRMPLQLTSAVHHEKERAGLSWSELEYRCQGKEMCRSDLLKVADKLDNQTFRDLAMSDILWDEVDSIAIDAMEETFDMRVPEHSNFMPSLVVTHNSGAIEQDADICMFLYRGEVYGETNEGSTELIVAKNRHGEPGTIFLNFHKQSTQFVSVGVMEESPVF